MSFSDNSLMRAAALIAVAGSTLLTACGGGKPPAQAPQNAAVEVGVIELKSRRVALTSELPGRTSPYLIAEVRPQVNGIIQKRQFEEGGDVKAGQSLYQIDPSTYQAILNSAEAALAKSEASLISTRLRAERYKELVGIKAVSQQDFDDAVAAQKQGEADVQANKAAVETARINLEYTRVVSPISGRIGRSSVTPGALVTANQATPMSTVQQLDPIYVDVTQSSTQLLRLKREFEKGHLQSSSGSSARVGLLLEDGTLYPQMGELKFSDVTVDQGTGAITLRAVFPNPKRLLLPGMYVRAVLEEGVDEHAILVPQEGVSRDNKGNAVAMVVGADGKVEARSLVTNRAVGHMWLIDSGLKSGDQMIVEGLQKIRPGVPVKPAPAKIASEPLSQATMEAMSGMEGMAAKARRSGKEGGGMGAGEAQPQGKTSTQAQ
ncbi:MAG: efflux RND transporter periplasmic adaptor subunit [Betaproteobacteria bacterium]|nr:efflux RND transporter periplasmic adaptor subunit [Betaproteobacteria bacterium]